MPSREPAPRPPPIPAHAVHRRSVAFLERQGRRWACFLVTREEPEGWRGYFAFRPSDGDEGDEIRTTDIFLEPREGDVRNKARQLGRPWLVSLLDSALHVRARDDDGTPFLRRWFRDLLAEHSTSPAGPGERAGVPSDPAPDLDELRSLYASYRLDQVAHLIALVDAEAFEGTVQTLLDGQGIDFSARDRVQLAMLVVDQLEALLPLPPFEVWAPDFLAHRDRYRAYAHALHREGRLP